MPVVREALTANRTYYRSTSGNDANNGLSPGAAVATFGKALALIRELDFNGFVVTLNVSGNATEILDIVGPFVGQKNDADFVITGDPGTPSNCTITNSAACIVVHAGSRCKVEGFKVVSSGGHGLQVYSQARCDVGAMEWGACGAAHMQAADGLIRRTANWTVSGDAPIHGVAEVGNGHIDFVPEFHTTTFSGTRTFSDVFLDVGENGTISIHKVVWSGSFTGKKYRIANSGSLTPVANRDSIPGSIAGTSEEVFTNLFVGSVATYARELSIVGAVGEVVATPSANTQIVVSNNGEAGIAIHSSSSGSGWIYFGCDGADGNVKGSIEYDHASDAFGFRANGAAIGSWSANGVFDITSAYRVNGTQVVGAQGTAVADASGGTVVDVEARAAINALLARLRAHGLIAT
jgi:hypothetical protein